MVIRLCIMPSSFMKYFLLYGNAKNKKNSNLKLLNFPKIRLIFLLFSSWPFLRRNSSSTNSSFPPFLRRNTKYRCKPVKGCNFIAALHTSLEVPVGTLLVISILADKYNLTQFSTYPLWVSSARYWKYKTARSVLPCFKLENHCILSVQKSSKVFEKSLFGSRPLNVFGEGDSEGVYSQNIDRFCFHF